MKKIFFQGLITTASLLFLIACSTSSELDKTYMQASSVKPISLPKGLSKPKVKNTLVIPHEDVADNGIAPEHLEIPPPLEGVIEVDLETEEKVLKREKITSRLLRNPDGMQTLEISSGLDHAWPLVREAFELYGFTIRDENRGDGYYVVSKEYQKRPESTDPRKFELDNSQAREKYMVVLEQATAGEAKLILTIRNESKEIIGSALAEQLLVQLQNYLGDPPDKVVQKQQVPAKVDE